MLHHQLLQGMEAIGAEHGEALYPTLNDSQKAIIAFGMTPIEVINPLEADCRRIVAEQISASMSGPGEPKIDAEKIKKAVKPDVIQAFTHGVILGLMMGATKAGAMIA